MAFCTKCGSKIEEGVKFCGNCGYKINSDGPHGNGEKTNLANTVDTYQQSKETAVLAEPIALKTTDENIYVPEFGYPKFIERLAGYAVDCSIMAAIVSVGAVIIPIIGGIIGGFLYFFLMEAHFGATVGMKSFGLQIVDLNGNKLTTALAFKHCMLRLLSYFLLLVPFFHALSDEKAATLFDKWAGCVMIKTKA